MAGRNQIQIVGAGFSGLVTAYYLVRQGARVRIIEKADRAGGLLSTDRHAYGLVETAANGILNSALVEEMFQDCQVRFAKAGEGARRRYIFRGRPRQWPLGVFETAGFLLRFLPRLFLARDSLRALPGESVAEWGRRQMGEAATEFLLSPGLQGIYAGDIRRMNASLLANRLFFQTEKPPKPRGKKGTVAPEGGMGALITGVRSYLQNSSQAELVHREVKSLAEFATEHVVVATSAWQAAGLVEPVAPRMAALLSRIEMLPVFTVTCFFDKTRHDLNGFGCLFPEREAFHSLGVLFNNCIFDGRSEKRSETWIFGGARYPDIDSMADSDFLEQIHADRIRLMPKNKHKALDYQVTRWPKALPHYDAALAELLQQYPADLPQRISLVGNYVGTLGLGRIMHRSKMLADQLAADAAG